MVLCAAVPHVPTSFMESELPLISLSVVLIPMPARCFSQGQGLGISRRRIMYCFERQNSTVTHRETWGLGGPYGLGQSFPRSVPQFA